jgi:hypothetical protein
MMELDRFDTKSIKSVPMGTLFPKCSQGNTFFLSKNGSFLVSFPVIIMTLRKNTVRLISIYYRVSGNQNFVSLLLRLLTGGSKKLEVPFVAWSDDWY